MPIPRRFDRRPPERDTTRINERIRVPEVRLIDENGEQIGVMKTDDALKYARERDLDLVEIAAEARPPVTRVLDYSKYKYEQEQKKKAARKHQQQVTVREMKLRPKIATHDYETKKGHILRFLKQGQKVKVTIMFRGREMAHPERGEALLRKVADELAEFGTIEQRPNQEGRNMIMMLAPVKAPVRKSEPRAEEARRPRSRHRPPRARAGRRAARRPDARRARTRRSRSRPGRSRAGAGLQGGVAPRRWTLPPGGLTDGVVRLRPPARRRRPSHCADLRRSRDRPLDQRALARTRWRMPTAGSRSPRWSVSAARASTWSPCARTTTAWSARPRCGCTRSRSRMERRATGSRQTPGGPGSAPARSSW